MNETQNEKKEYDAMVKKASPNSPIMMDCIKAFISGGAICTLGQFIHNYIARYSFTEDEVGLITSIILIFISAVLTGLGIYERLGIASIIGKFALNIVVVFPIALGYALCFVWIKNYINFKKKQTE